MSFPDKVAEEMLVKSGRCCCVCHKFCGTNIELHHIIPKSKGGEDTADNCIPLCFDCHANVEHYNNQHPRGQKYSPSELKMHRDKWINKVENGIGIVGNELWIKVDRKLYQQISGLLPVTLVNDFACQHDFAGAFRKEMMEPFLEFCRLSQYPDFEFLDPDLEAFRVRLSNTIYQFKNFLVAYTFTDDTEIYSIPRAHKEADINNFDAEFARLSVLYEQHANELNRAATQVCECYASFVRFARRKLAV